MLARMAEAERVAPLIYRAVMASAALQPACEPAVLESLRLAYYANSARNAVLFQELECILQLLDKAGIPVIVLKGAWLAHQLYQDVALRPMNDLDLLVEKGDLDRAVALLYAAGYRRLAVFQNDAFENQLGHAVHLVHLGKPGVEVEVHWQLASGEASLFQPEMAWFWQTAETRRVGGRRMAVLWTPPTACSCAPTWGSSTGSGWAS